MQKKTISIQNAKKSNDSKFGTTVIIDPSQRKKYLSIKKSRDKTKYKSMKGPFVFFLA